MFAAAGDTLNQHTHKPPTSSQKITLRSRRDVLVSGADDDDDDDDGPDLDSEDDPEQDRGTGLKRNSRAGPGPARNWFREMVRSWWLEL